MFVTPHPHRSNSRSSPADNNRSVNPPRNNAGQNRFPGRAK
jgi:hypothetical protein